MTEKLGVIYWNTWYRAHPESQLTHLEQLQERLRDSGAARVLLCLSEVTSSSFGGGLHNLLDQSGYATEYQITSELKPDYYEGVVVASADPELSKSVRAADFSWITSKRGFKNMKHRSYGETSVLLGGDYLRVGTSHLSAVKPSRDEIEHAQTFHPPDIYGGDFNTLASKRYVKILQERGMTKLTDPDTRITVPFVKRGEIGCELDHVVVAGHLAASATLEVADVGPSNHRPLLVSVEA